MKLRWAAIVFLAIGNFFVWTIVWWSQPSDILQVAFLDVGQGDSILITAPNKNQILIDGGPNKKVIRALGQTIPFFDRSIDLIIATHPDLDHIGGLSDVFDRFIILAYLASPAISESAVFKTLQTKVDIETAQQIIAVSGMKIILDKNTILEIFNAGTKDDKGNAASLIAKLTYGEVDFLLMGDAPMELEDKLAYKIGQKLESEVLKVSHHGAKSSSSKNFLQKVSPRYAVISAGADNRYGHPHSETLLRLKAVEAKILQTKDLGTIIFETDGHNLQHK
ncbi:MAG: MBL fold metallo-hydrolase [Candidatus Paceibacterota bacterium]|jgi:competence protein ComEC